MKTIHITKKDYRANVMAMEMAYAEFEYALDEDRAKWARKLVRAISKCQKTPVPSGVGINEDFSRWLSIDKCKKTIREYKMDLANVG